MPILKGPTSKPRKFPNRGGGAAPFGKIRMVKVVNPSPRDFTFSIEIGGGQILGGGSKKTLTAEAGGSAVVKFKGYIKKLTSRTPSRWSEVSVQPEQARKGGAWRKRGSVGPSPVGPAGGLKKPNPEDVQKGEGGTPTTSPVVQPPNPGQVGITVVDEEGGTEAQAQQIQNLRSKNADLKGRVRSLENKLRKMESKLGEARNSVPKARRKEIRIKAAKDVVRALVQKGYL